MRRSLCSIATLAAPAIALAQPTAPTIYVLNNVSDSVAWFTVATDGVLTHVGNVATSDGPTSAALSPGGRWLAVGHGTINDVVEVLLIYSVAADGTPTQVLSTTVPDSPLDMKWVSDSHLAVLETGASFVRMFEFDPMGPTLTEIDNAFSGSFTSSIALTPDRSLLFVQDSFNNAIRSFTVNPDGTIDLANIASTAPTFALDLTVTNDATKIYSAGGISNGGDKVSGLAIDAMGVMTPLPNTPYVSPGASPAHVIATDDDAFLLVGHGTDATVRSFTINPDGSLTATGFFFDVGGQGTLGDLAMLDRFLFVTDESTALDGIAGVYSFTVRNNGSLAQNGPIQDTMGVRPEWIVAWPGLTPGDFNGDGLVNGADLATLLSQWGGPGSADLNGDGVVNGTDLAELLANWTG